MGKVNTNAIARDHENEVSEGYKAAGCNLGGRIRRNDYGQSEPDVVRGAHILVGGYNENFEFVLLREVRLTFVIECKARDEGYPATLRGWHDQNDAYAKRHTEDIVIAPVHVKNRPGRGGKVERFVSMHEQEYFDLLALIPKKEVQE